MLEDLEGRLDGEFPEGFTHILNSAAKYWEELEFMDSQNLLVCYGQGDFDEKNEKEFVTFDSKKLRRHYSAVCSKDPQSILLHYCADLRKEVQGLIKKQLYSEAINLRNILGTVCKNHPLLEMITPIGQKGITRIDYSRIQLYSEVTKDQADGEDYKNTLLMAYIVLANEALKERVSRKELPKRINKTKTPEKKKAHKK